MNITIKQQFYYNKMVTNYSQYDTLEGKDLWKMGVSLALAFGGLCGAIKYANNSSKYPNNLETQVKSGYETGNHLADPNLESSIKEDYRTLKR